MNEITLADLPELPQGVDTAMLERIQKNDMLSLAQDYCRKNDTATLFHELHKCGLLVGAGCIITISGNEIPYVVTRINPAEHAIVVTKWDFWNNTDSFRTIELVGMVQRPDPFNKISKIKGHLGEYSHT